MLHRNAHLRIPGTQTVQQFVRIAEAGVQRAEVRIRDPAAGVATRRAKVLSLIHI